MEFIRKLFKSDSRCPFTSEPEKAPETVAAARDIVPESLEASPPQEAPVFDPKAPGYVQNPYPLFARMRQHFPVFRAPSGAWVISRYEDVFAGFTDKRLGNAPSPFAVVHSRNRGKYVCADVASNIIPFMDPPQHNGPRRIIARAFHSHITRQPPAALELATERIRQYAAQGEMDIISDYGTPLSIGILCELLGLPLEDQSRLKIWTESFFYLFASMPSEEVRAHVDQALTEFRTYLKEKIEEKKNHPGIDLLSALMVAEDKGETLSDSELIDNTMLLFADGVENVDRGIGNAVFSLLTHPEQWERLKKEPALMSQAVDECLRYESPAQFVGKVALEDMEWRGETIKKHSGVLLMVGSANRDPEKFPDPDRLDIRRDSSEHLAFGRGRHSCVGAYLVKLQMEAALQALVNEIPCMRLTQPEVTWETRLAHRWIHQVQIQFN